MGLSCRHLPSGAVGKTGHPQDATTGKRSKVVPSGEKEWVQRGCPGGSWGFLICILGAPPEAVGRPLGN